MIDCDELIPALHVQTQTQVQLALLADATEVAAMHIDLARFSEERARAAERWCEAD